jgi:hypothetical protein
VSLCEGVRVILCDIYVCGRRRIGGFSGYCVWIPPTTRGSRSSKLKQQQSRLFQSNNNKKPYSTMKVKTRPTSRYTANQQESRLVQTTNDYCSSLSLSNSLSLSFEKLHIAPKHTLHKWIVGTKKGGTKSHKIR